jgi:chromosomal replication initiator protein
MEDVLSVVSSLYGLERAELLSYARTRRLHRPRQIAMYLSDLVSGAKPDEIGAVFGGRDGTIIRMHCRAIARECRQDLELSRLVQSMEMEIRRRGRLS